MNLNYTTQLKQKMGKKEKKKKKRHHRSSSEGSDSDGGYERRKNYSYEQEYQSSRGGRYEDDGSIMEDISAIRNSVSSASKIADKLKKNKRRRD